MPGKLGFERFAGSEHGAAHVDALRGSFVTQIEPVRRVADGLRAEVRQTGRTEGHEEVERRARAQRETPAFVRPLDERLAAPAGKVVVEIEVVDDQAGLIVDGRVGCFSVSSTM